ncbi:MAG: HAMP domain-containing histidine kinase [Candidatus Sericytochromatia bacterium]|nr:HAMP domain-containing histidine kinase [Candidatus Tanganyikabacteria bacterium]
MDPSPLAALARVTAHLESLEKLVAERVLELEAANLELKAARDELAVAHQEALRLSRLKDEFVAIASHELRTPLTAIKGFAVLLEDDQATREEIQEAARVISAQTDRLIRILDDMLDVARIEAGTLPVNISDAGMGEIFARAVEMVRRKYGDRPVRITGADVIICSDAGKLEQIILNLLDNACKYGPPDSPVSVVARALADGVAVEVHNDGPGLTREEQEALFEKFRRLERTRGEAEGTGLGLYITRNLVELLGGAIVVDSAPGTGVTFSFRLPNLPSPEPAIPD